HHHHEIRVLARFSARTFIRNNERRAWQHDLRNDVERLRSNGYAVEGRLRCCRIAWCRSDVAGLSATRLFRWSGRDVRRVRVHGHHVPAHLTGSPVLIERSEDKCADRPLRVVDRHRALEDRIVALTDIEALGLPADEY